ncbi:aminotransferase class V-fold PLP-dependent enzyme [Roseiconus lacunae]|uniref:aminotransferase class V-fold PLP-dependent enzyme n=1 Tax=Roseiconus lacunae TaxID=2605694 RepID=UPI00308EBF39|nr:aminotransferase class V-fold PLP-dependent enzyme [Stieleria sp. HD01]
MSPSASRRHGELARFAIDAAASPLMDSLLNEGGAAWPDPIRREFPSLSDFPGIAGFRQRVLKTLGCADWQQLILGTTSNSLIRIASQLLFGPCRRVLTTDLVWPVYRKVLERRSSKRSSELCIIPLRQFIFQNHPTASQLIDFVANQFCERNCDGLFLTAVSHDGIRLPVAEMIAAIKGRSEVKVSVIDGAQEFAQVDHRNSLKAADFYMTSGHKWAGSYVPISIGVFGADRTASRIGQVLAHQIESGLIDDPLMQLCWDSTDSQPISAPSTANVAALFACDAAITDFARNSTSACSGPLAEDEMDGLYNPLKKNGWRTMLSSQVLRSRTTVLHHEALERHSPATVRRCFASEGIALTAFDHGRVRLSIPRGNWTTDIQIDVGRRFNSVHASLTKTT